jgi:hypothetical protein
MTPQERQEAIRARTRKNYEIKDQGGYTVGKNVLDFESVGGYKKEMIYKPEISERGKDIINKIDILPFSVTTNNLKEILPGDFTYCADLGVHRKMGATQNDTFLCTEYMYGEICPVCEERRALKNKGISGTALTDNPLGTKRRCIYNVVDLNVPKEKRNIQIFEEIHYWFEKKLLEATAFGNGKFEAFWDPEFGCSVEFVVTASNTSAGKNLNYTINFCERKEPAKYSEKIMQETYPLDKMLIHPSYEDVKNAFYSIGTGDTPEEAEPVKNTDQNEQREELPTRDINDDLRRPSFDEEEPVRGVSGPENPPVQSRRLSRRRNKEEEVEENNKCPYGHVFGRDNELKQECSTCPDEFFHKCDDERLRLEKEGK